MSAVEASFWSALVVGLGPLLLLLFVFVPRAWANRNTAPMAKLTSAATLTVLLLAALGALQVAFTRKTERVFAALEPFQIGVYFDALSAIVFLMVAFLGVVVMRYACTYLQGDGEQGKFLKWLCVTIGAVLTLSIANNLVLFTLAWIATSLSLNKLLTFYGHRPSALIAARKKYVISRMGDVCLIGAIILTYRIFGTWEFSELFARVAQLRLREAALPGEVTVLCLLLVGGACMKSAQFPFHSWLPDTLETPTPVSALMHAGIINAGGFLIVRLSPIITLAPVALDVLVVVGAFTAIFASCIMMTQASIKRMLAFSTVAQMGFMMLQCGLGAFSIAVLHIVAHSLYKAHAFLSSGSVVEISESSWLPISRPATKPGVLLAAMCVSIALVFAIGLAFGVSLASEPGAFILGAVLMMALAHFLWSLWGQAATPRLLATGLLVASAVTAAYFALHIAFQFLLDSSVPHETISGSKYSVILVIGIIAIFAVVLMLQEQLAALANRPWCRALYVHARNGFYFNTLANRFIQAVWTAR